MPRLTKFKRGDIVKFKKREFLYSTRAETINPNPPANPQDRHYKILEVCTTPTDEYGLTSQTIYLRGSDHIFHNWQFTLIHRASQHERCTLLSQFDRPKKKKKGQTIRRIGGRKKKFVPVVGHTKRILDLS